MHRLSFLLLILSLCTLATCSIIPFLGTGGLGEKFENAKSRKCRKEEHDRCFKECRRITKKITVRCYEPETMYCYCRTKKRYLPSFELFRGKFENSVEADEEADQNEREEAPFRGCRIKGAKGACEELQPAY